MATEVKVQDRFIPLNGLRFHYREWGTAGAPALLLLHGLAGHARLWDTFAPAMCDWYRVLALDLRGHGETEWAEDYALERLVADVAAFVNWLALPRVTVVGHSLGGIVAYMYAARHPETVERLVIDDMGPDVLVRGEQPIQLLLRARQAAFAQPEEAVRAARQINPRGSLEQRRDFILSNLVRRVDGRWVWRYDAERLALLSQGALTEAVQWELLRQIARPTLLVRGAQTDTLRRETAERMVGEMPDCRLVEVPDSGHVVPLDNPAGFLAAVQAFLTTDAGFH